MRRTLAALASVSLAALGSTAISPVASATPPTCGETFSGGAGTTSDPFLISSAADFTALNGDEYCWPKVFLQTANIDMGDITWDIPGSTPASTTGTDAVPFSGTYDGGNFHISGLTIDRGDSLGDDNGGLVGVVTGTIRNLGFIDSDLSTETVLADDVAGGLVGSLRGGTVSNSYATVYVFSDNDYAGGLVGEALGGATIENSYSTGIVEGDEYSVGGLVGEVSDANSSVRGSYSSADVTGGDAGGEGTGGLVGLLTEASIINSYATGGVAGDTSVGGLLGSNDDGTVSGSYATGNVSTSSTDQETYVAGLIGFNSGAVTDCYATGSATAPDAAGLVSFNTGTITNCYSTGTVTGTSARGLISLNPPTGVVSNSFWDIETSGVTISTRGTGKTTTEMKTLATFTDAGWSITESCSSTAVWGLCSARNSGYPYLTFYTAAPSGSPDAQTETLVLTSDSGVTCRHSEVTGGRGLWVKVPTADDCSVAGKPDARVLGWATRSNFPVEMARRQVDNGWGPYEWSNDEGQTIGVFIPAGGSTLLSNSVRLYPIVGDGESTS